MQIDSAVVRPSLLPFYSLLVALPTRGVTVVSFNTTAQNLSAAEVGTVTAAKDAPPLSPEETTLARSVACDFLGTLASRLSAIQPVPRALPEGFDPLGSESWPGCDACRKSSEEFSAVCVEHAQTAASAYVDALRAITREVKREESTAEHIRHVVAGQLSHARARIGTNNAVQVVSSQELAIERRTEEEFRLRASAEYRRMLSTKEAR